LKQFCFSDGEAIHEESGECAMWCIVRATKWASASRKPPRWFAKQTNKALKRRSSFPHSKDAGRPVGPG
jgi:hypothetical protein